MATLLQQLLNGITLGSVYALLALSITMIFGVLGVMAFAQGAVYMLSAYVGLFVVTQMHGYSILLTLPLALVCAAAVGACVNVLIDQLTYRPLRNAGRLSSLISGIGVYFFIENAIGLLVGRKVFAFPAVLPAAQYQLGEIRVTAAQLTVLGTTAAAVAALWYLVRRTEVGLIIRGVSERAETAVLMSINPERIILLTFAVAGALSGVAGVLIGAFIGVVAPSMGFLIGMKAFAAAVVAGIGNIPGALIGGLLVGIIETLSSGYISAAWSDAIVFLMLVLVLVIRPDGLIGAQAPQRA
ncbi:LIV-I protein H (plasmid) [Variovorax sp. SRS16]|uniref:branched-chain amino acid ABC transporter permease n=1 Tax=Variovorax sp. SRS16 TaxID=282217 RepID=UPI0013193F86|nr:branched-chain amino acid ABC transporter permease [Variovorax sp. SRS16]VTU45876.1 LIV-I protein H [Variovorax sp. SRS16]